ncbi:unnamed protein product, partial [Prorocentrum cordatum]
MAQLSDIQTLLDNGFGKLRKDLKVDILKEMGQLIDAKFDVRLKQEQDELMGEIWKLQERTAALEARADSGGVGTKRALSEGPGYRAARTDFSDNGFLVFKGLPFLMWSRALVRHAETVFHPLSPNSPLPQIRAASNTTHVRLIFNDSASAKTVFIDIGGMGQLITICTVQEDGVSTRAHDNGLDK